MHESYELHLPACVHTFLLGRLSCALGPGCHALQTRALQGRRQTPHPLFLCCLLRAMCGALQSVWEGVRILPSPLSSHGP